MRTCARAREYATPSSESSESPPIGTSASHQTQSESFRINRHRVNCRFGLGGECAVRFPLRLGRNRPRANASGTGAAFAPSLQIPSALPVACKVYRRRRNLHEEALRVRCWTDRQSTAHVGWARPARLRPKQVTTLNRARSADRFDSAYRPTYLPGGLRGTASAVTGGSRGCGC